jgi:RND superfamily putative drug exporter
MVSVFASFMLVDDPTVKMFGLGLAAAIAIDATIVRCLLVPAAMLLMGRANWWLPSWLAPRLPTITIEPHVESGAVASRARPSVTSLRRGPS